MVEHGIIKWFSGRRRLGFITVLDVNDAATGEIWFHENDQRGACDQQFLGEEASTVPATGTRVVFERTPGKNNRSKAIWAKEADWLQTSWRVVQKISVTTGIVEFANTVDESCREDASVIISAGVSSATLEKFQRWTSTLLEFYAEDVSMHEQGSEIYCYYLQTMQDGKWTDVKRLKPIPELPHCSSCKDRSCEECILGIEEEYPSPIEVLARARRSGLTSEEALEAATQYPGDFI